MFYRGEYISALFIHVKGTRQALLQIAMLYSETL